MRLHPGECRVKGSNALIREPYGSSPNNDNLIAECFRWGSGLTALDDIGDSIAWEAVLTARCRFVRGQLGGTEMIDEHPPLLVGGDLKALASRHQPHLDFLVSTHGHKRVGIAVTLLQIALQKAQAQRRKELVLLRRHRCLLRRHRCLLHRHRGLPTTRDRHTQPPTVLRNEWIIANDTVVGVRTAIEKAVAPDSLG